MAVLLAFGIGILAPAVVRGAEAPVAALGKFQKWRFSQEHQYGYEVDLWEQGDRRFGLLLVGDGLAGDTPTGMLEDVEFDAHTGKLSFSARLTTGLHYCREHDGVASRDVFRFSGVLSKSDLTGKIQHSDALHPGEAARTEHVTLRRAAAELTVPASYVEWKADADTTLKRRGPRW